jgi:flagellar biosynthesis anti-sigma factor FlgM
MPNSISDINSALGAGAVENVGAVGSASRVGPPTSTPASETSATPTDSTSISSIGNLLSGVTQSARAQQSVRPDVVARIKSQLAAGTYKPDATAVAASVYRAIRAGQ